jgi:hypothetical protein
MTVACVLAVIAFCASVVWTTNLIGVALGGSLALIILFIGYGICWHFVYLHNPRTQLEDPLPVHANQG